MIRAVGRGCFLFERTIKGQGNPSKGALGNGHVPRRRWQPYAVGMQQEARSRLVVVVVPCCSSSGIVAMVHASSCSLVVVVMRSGVVEEVVGSLVIFLCRSRMWNIVSVMMRLLSHQKSGAQRRDWELRKKGTLPIGLGSL